MSKAVRFNQYGEIDVLQVVDVERPVPGPGQVLVNVKAAGINPGEASIRKGLLASRWPATFPSGQGSDLAGVVAALGEGVQGFAVGDEVIGFTNNRASQAEFVVVEASDLTPRPRNVPWEVAGSLFVAGATAYAAIRAVSLQKGDTLAVSGAAGGVGSIVVQLAVKAGAKVIGLASSAHHQWLRDLGVILQQPRRMDTVLALQRLVVSYATVRHDHRDGSAGCEPATQPCKRGKNGARIGAVRLHEEQKQ